MKLAVALICVLLCVITTSKAQTTGCNLCQFIVNYADQYIESNRTMTKINEALNKVCDIFPAGFQELVSFRRSNMANLEVFGLH